MRVVLTGGAQGAEVDDRVVVEYLRVMPGDEHVLDGRDRSKRIVIVASTGGDAVPRRQA